MYIEEEIQKTMKLFNELSSSELIKDDEVKQLNKITEIIEKLSTGDTKQGVILDDLFKEILQFRDVVADKYIRIGTCLERIS